MSRRAILAVVLLLATVLASRAAWCEEITPTAITDPVTTLKPGLHLVHPLSTHFLLDRFRYDVCRADAMDGERLRADLAAERQARIDDRKPESRWQVASRWAGFGVAVGAAFVAGMWVAK